MKESQYKAFVNNRKSSKPSQPDDQVAPTDSAVDEAIAKTSEKVKRGRGRPKTGKSSSDGYVSRTFYIKEETDLDIEELLVKLKRKGIRIDKSELVEILLSGLVNWHNGENLESSLAEISPI